MCYSVGGLRKAIRLFYMVDINVSHRDELKRTKFDDYIQSIY